MCVLEIKRPVNYYYLIDIRTKNSESTSKMVRCKLVLLPHFFNRCICHNALLIFLCTSIKFYTLMIGDAKNSR